MIVDPVRLPRLLRPQLESNQTTLKEVGRLHPADMSVQLNIVPLCRASLTLLEDDLPVQIHDFVELYGQNGSFGIYRVVNVSTTYKKQRKIELSHALDVFSDVVLSGETTISGVRQALQYIIAGQTANIGGTPLWQLGTVSDTNAYTMKVEFSNAMQCLSDLANAEDEYFYTFDFSVFPWKLNFIKRSETVVSEFRLPRNVENCQVTLDDSELCTKLYLSVDTTTQTENGPVTTTTHEIHDYAAGQAQWGIVCRTAGIDMDEVANKTAWINRFFRHYGKPILQITINGEEINKLTGESLDRIRLGRVCRVALPDYNSVFDEQIVSLTYSDVLRNPMGVVVEMANRKNDAGGSFARLSNTAQQTKEQARKNRNGGRGSAAKIEEKNKEYWTKFDQNDYEISLVAAHADKNGEILEKAGISINSQGVLIYADDNPNMLGSRFNVTAAAISAEVTNRKNADDQMSSRITQTADAITAEVTRAKGAEGTLRSSINVNAEQIELRVEKGKIASTINQTAQGVTIQASKIDLSGYVTASDLEATNATVSNLMSGQAVATQLSCRTFSASQGFNFVGNPVSWQSRTVLTDLEGGTTTIRYLGRV